MVPIIKKNIKQELKKYRTISLLQYLGKIFERSLYDNMSKFFTKNDLISQNKSGFKSGGSCTYQLVSITHQIYTFFDSARS